MMARRASGNGSGRLANAPCARLNGYDPPLRPEAAVGDDAFRNTCDKDDGARYRGEGGKSALENDRKHGTSKMRAVKRGRRLRRLKKLKTGRSSDFFRLLIGVPSTIDAHAG